jgi:hypothetical protein
MSTGANFVTPAALAAARRRVASPEPHEMLAVDRLWADLLSSMPLCFNLFGDLDGDRPGAASAVRAWWPAAPAGVLRSDETYEARTIEDLIATPGTISVETRTAIVGRYL